MTALTVAADTVVDHAGFFWPWFLLIPLAWILVLVALFAFGRRFWWRRHWSEVQGNGDGYGYGPSSGYAAGAGYGTGVGHGASYGAEGVLRERFARGEIDETEFWKRLEVLRAQQGS